VLALIACAGCGEADGGRIAFSGRVTRGDEPVPQGFVSFHPAEGHTGPAANADIKDGVYRFTASDGPLPGPHRATVTIPPLGSKAVGAAAASEPSKWEFDVLVAESGEFEADFHLEAP
jgi:hypothetical protein